MYWTLLDYSLTRHLPNGPTDTEAEVSVKILYMEENASCLFSS